LARASLKQSVNVGRAVSFFISHGISAIDLSLGTFRRPVLGQMAVALAHPATSLVPVPLRSRRGLRSSAAAVRSQSPRRFWNPVLDFIWGGEKKGKEREKRKERKRSYGIWGPSFPAPISAAAEARSFSASSALLAILGRSLRKGNGSATRKLDGGFSFA